MARIDAQQARAARGLYIRRNADELIVCAARGQVQIARLARCIVARRDPQNPGRAHKGEMEAVGELAVALLRECRRSCARTSTHVTIRAVARRMYGRQSQALSLCRTTPSAPLGNALAPPLQRAEGTCDVEANLPRGSLSPLRDEDHCRLQGSRPHARWAVVWADRDGTSLRPAGRASRQGVDGALEPRARTVEHPTPAADPASRWARHGHHRPSGTGNSFRAVRATSYRRVRARMRRGAAASPPVARPRRDRRRSCRPVA
jgi:hypothetical protein